MSSIGSKADQQTTTEAAWITAAATGVLSQIQTSTPANPSLGSMKLYFKSDGNLYSLNSSGNESQMAAGSTSWGNITGTLSSQLDLSNSLNLKAPLNSPTFTGVVTIPSGASITGFATTASPTFTGTVTIPTLSQTGLISKYNNVSTAGLGVPAIYATARSTAQSGAVGSVTTFTVGASDASFMIVANANITAFTAGTFNITVAYTDETNTGQTLKLNFSSLTGTIGIALAATGPFEGLPAYIRAKAGTTITIATSGTFTSLTYNVEGLISQLA